VKAEFRLTCEVPATISLSQLEECLREELSTLLTVLGTKGELDFYSASPQPLKRARRKIAICVPVVVAASGRWAVSACSEIPASLCQLESEHFLNECANKHVVWISAEVPLPDEFCVKGVPTNGA
jgi:hypothetical protein